MARQLNIAFGLFLSLVTALMTTTLVCDANGSQYKDFLMLNHLPSGMPKSFAIEPPNYFQKIPRSLKNYTFTHNETVPACADRSIDPHRLNEYTFQTELLISALGLDIYDGAVWTIALSILGEADHAYNYTKDRLVADRSQYWGNLRGNSTCNGVIAWGQCEDPHQDGACGLCYGLNATSLDHRAWFFRFIADDFAVDGQPDARCPHLLNWTWNDWQPVLGENAWAQLQGPAHNAMARHNNTPDNIPDDDPLFFLGISFLRSLEVMEAADTGAVFYAPWNTYFGTSHAAMDVAESFSIENQGSLLGGLRSLYWIIEQKNSSVHKKHMARIKKVMAGLQKILLESWNGEYFVQGGTYNRTTGKVQWHQENSPSFAVDCQTWIGSVLGVKVVDGTFGNLTSYNLWQTVKRKAGYMSADGWFYGVGYTDNSIGGQVLSGEWTYGAINWVRVMIAEGGYNSTIVADLQNDISNMIFGLETDIITKTYVGNSTEKYSSALYANRRYYIPFGWWANDIPALCSTAWALCVDRHYNPFNVNGGQYSYLDSFTSPMVERSEKEKGKFEIKESVLREIKAMEDKYFISHGGLC